MPETITQNTQTPAPAAQTQPNPLDAILAAHGQQTAAAEQDDADELDTDATEQAEEEEAPDDRQLNVLLRKAEKAFIRGKKAEVLSRVECGKWCHEIYSLRQGLKRDFTSTLIFNRLAVHADSKSECDGDVLAHLYKTVELLCEPERWKAMAKLPEPPLTIGKLTVLRKLVKRVEGTEVYGVFDTAKEAQAKALFVWACGDGLKKVSLDDIKNRVSALIDPVKYAQAQEQKAKDGEKPKDAATDADEDETPAPANIISTDAARPAAPDWKDVPEGMSAQYNEAMRQAPQEMAMVREQLIAKLAKLPIHDVIGWMVAFFKEGCKRNPGHTGDIMTGFARSVAWTKSSVAGLVQGIADSAEDREDTDAILQELSDTIADEYSIFAAMGEDVDEETEAAAA